jgi:hypothetical protein
VVGGEVEIGALFPVLLVAVAVGVLVFVVVNGIQERATLRASLRQVTGPVVENQRDRELLDPLRQRAIDPLLGSMSGLGRRFTPVGYVEKVRLKFTHAGIADQSAVDRFLAIRVATVVGAVLVFVLLFVLNVLGLSGMVRIAVPGLLAAVLAGPALAQQTPLKIGVLSGLGLGNGLITGAVGAEESITIV